MRGRLGALILAIVVASGCLAVPQEIDAAATPAEPASTEPGLLASPRLLAIPAGSSYSLVWLNATEEDWVDYDGGRKMINFAYETPGSAKFAGLGIMFMEVEEGALVPRGSHISTGGGGGGSSGSIGEPERVQRIAAVSVVDAKAPFEMRLGADEWLDGNMEGERVPASVIAQGAYDGFGFFFEFGTPFSAVFDSEPASAGLDVEDARIHPPVGSDAAGALGKLRLAKENALQGGGIHVNALLAASFNGPRVGTWTYSLALDGEETTTGGLYAQPGPLFPSIHASATARSDVSVTVELDALAETLPITVFSSTTIPWDPASVGLAFEERFFEYAPLPLLHTPVGCIALDAAPPQWAPGCGQLAQ